MLEFDNLAQELVEMFVSELHLKRLLVLQLLSVNLKEGAEEHHPSLELLDELYDGEFYEIQSIGLQSGECCPLPKNWSADASQAWQPGHTPSHEVLQVYLTSWLSNVNIKTSRINEIFELVGGGGANQIILKILMHMIKEDLLTWSTKERLTPEQNHLIYPRVSVELHLNGTNFEVSSHHPFFKLHQVAPEIY